MKTSFLIEACWRLLLFLFLYTALDKLLNFQDFTAKINSQPIDDRYTTVLTYAIPALELMACTLLIFARTRRWGFLLSIALMLVFTIYVALVTFHFFAKAPCSCSAIHEKLSWPEHLIVNVAFLALSVWGFYHSNKLKSKEPTNHFALKTDTT